MATFVIVHGGWGGGWEWRQVAHLLTGRGHEACTPTLTGLGERSHLLSRSISLETHAIDVANVIHWERMSDVFLVGHSYGGMVITVAASRIRERIKGLIYVDAFIPENGQSEMDLIDPAWGESMILSPARREGEGWLVPYPFADDLHELPPDIADRYRESSHPLATFTDPAPVDDGVLSLPSAFVHCTRKDPGEDAFLGSEYLARRRGWTIREIRAGHDVQFEDPRGITDVLHDIINEL